MTCKHCGISIAVDTERKYFPYGFMHKKYGRNYWHCSEKTYAEPLPKQDTLKLIKKYLHEV